MPWANTSLLSDSSDSSSESSSFFMPFLPLRTSSDGGEAKPELPSGEHGDNLVCCQPAVNILEATLGEWESWPSEACCHCLVPLAALLRLTPPRLPFYRFWHLQKRTFNHSSDDSSDDDEEAAPKTNGTKGDDILAKIDAALIAPAANDDTTDESAEDSDDESSDSEADSEADSDDFDSDSESSESEEEAPKKTEAKKAKEDKKRKADDESAFAAKEAKVDEAAAGDKKYLFVD
jgi:hypothetical protein